MANPTEAQNIHSIVSSMTTAQVSLIAGAVGAVVSALVAAIFSILTTWLVKRAENERAIRELIVKCAIEQHKQHVEIAQVRGSTVLPVDAYIIHMLAVIKILLSKRVTSSNVAKLLDEISDITTASNKHIRQTRD